MVAVTSPDQNDWANELERQRFDAQSMPDLSTPPGGVASSSAAVAAAGGANRPGSADLLDYGKNSDDVFESPDRKSGKKSKVSAASLAAALDDSTASIPITKGGMGFGFTIADSAHGQKVKKILDRPRCKTLQEGDILVEINGVSVRTMSHREVVQVLKDCPRGHEAGIVIQRGHSLAANSPSKNKYKSKKEESFKPKSGFLFRSKTPTAELYASASQEKERLPNRPKTPLVDTRNMRSKTPTALGGGGGGSGAGTTSNAPFSRNDASRASLGGSNGYYNQMVDQMQNMGMGGYSASGGGAYGATGPDGVAMLMGQQQQQQRAKSPGNELEGDYQGYPQIMQQQQVYNHQQAATYNGYDEHHQQQHQNYVDYPMQADQLRSSAQQEPGYGYTAGPAVPPSSNMAMAAGYSPSGGGGYSAAGGYRAGSLPRGSSGMSGHMMGAAAYGGGGGGRKESTSFEHSEPLPGGLTRWPRSGAQMVVGPRGQPQPPQPINPTEWVEMTVTLLRQDSGFGFRIVGGTEEG